VNSSSGFKTGNHTTRAKTMIHMGARYFLISLSPLVGNWSCFDAILIDYLLFKSDVIKNFAKFVRLWGWRQQKYTTHLYGRAKKAQIVFFIKKKPFLKNRKPKWQDKNFDCKIRSNSWFFFKKKKNDFAAFFDAGRKIIIGK